MEFFPVQSVLLIMFHVQYVCEYSCKLAAGDVTSLCVTCREKRSERVSIFENEIPSFIQISFENQDTGNNGYIQLLVS